MLDERKCFKICHTYGTFHEYLPAPISNLFLSPVLSESNKANCDILTISCCFLGLICLRNTCFNPLCWPGGRSHLPSR